jgi:hypothetical protein
MKLIEFKKLIKEAIEEEAEQIAEVQSIPVDEVGKFFIVEEGEGGLSVHAVDRTGEKIFSRAKPGEYAEPDEAIELIINDYPHKYNILRTMTGGSSSGGNTSTSAGKRSKTMELANLPAGERLKALRRG